MADIFISYARADKARVERLVAALQANGWTAWWDAEVLSRVTGAYLPLDENFLDSIVLIDRSLALNPGSSLAWLMSGWLRAAAGDADRAVEHFEMSMRLDPCSSDRGYHRLYWRPVTDTSARPTPRKRPLPVTRRCVPGNSANV